MRQCGPRDTSRREKLPRFTRKVRRWRICAPTGILLWGSLLWCLPPDRVQAGGGDTAATGSIHGQVTITRKLTSQRMRFRLYPGFKPLPPPTGVENMDSELDNVVIYVESTTPTAAAVERGDNPQIAQKGETFIPHVLPIVKGTTVDFPNQDPIFHNVFSLSRTKAFDLGRYPKGDSRSVTFSQPGIVPVFCHLHSNMSAIILVLDNPLFVVPDADGSYRIDGIPPGIHTVVGWHERSQRVEQQVEITPGQSVVLNITIPIEDEER